MSAADITLITVVTGALWVAGALVTTMLHGPYAELETYDVVWWPLTLLKFLLRTLWQALTTGWRP